MARRSPVLFFGALALLLGGGVALAASSSPARKPKGEGEPAPAPPEGSGPQLPADPADRQDLLLRHQKGFIAGGKYFDAWAKGVIAENAQIEAFKEKGSSSPEATAIAAGLSIAAAAINAIPIVGQVASAVLVLFAVLVKTVPMGAWLPRVEARDLTGWAGDTYWYHDVPIYAPQALEMLEPLPHPWLGDNSQSFDGLRRLIAYFPLGPSWPVTIKVFGTGGADSYYEYSYLFNPTNPGDLSEAAKALNRVYGMTVYQPEDITPTGPRGFDPQSPLAWRVPGERRSRYA